MRALASRRDLCHYCEHVFVTNSPDKGSGR